MRNKILNLVQLSPLIVFLAYARGIGAKASGPDWKGPFIMGGCLALISILILMLQKRNLSRVLLGVNIHLITGGGAFIVGLCWLLGLYGKLGPASMLAWIILVGIAATLFSSKGFIDIFADDKKSVRLYSCYLLLVAIAAFGVSLFFRNTILVADVIPFLVIFISGDLLKSKFSEKIKEG